MRRPTAIYVTLVACLAATMTLILFGFEPHVDRAGLAAIGLLAGLAVLAEVLAFLLPRATRGSLAFIAYLAMVVLVPNWCAVVTVLAVKTLTEARARIAWYKAAFNIAQHAVGMVAAIIVYRSLGGVSLMLISPNTLLHTTQVAGGPAVAAFAVSYFCNAILVSAAVAIDSESRGIEVLRDLKLTTVGLDLLVSPPIFVFAWVYAAYGPLAAASLWVPFMAMRQAHKANLDLAQTNQELLELMVKSLEARDPYTSGHSRRVREYSMIIARALGCSQRQVEEVGRAALLHDVGKIHDKYAPILSKTEKLTRDEWLLMKDHPADGANLVATVSRLRDIIPSIRHHHENWDGTGYPDALAGEQIPFAARIIRFADTIDAMTTQRPYRAPLTEEQVRHEVIRCRGSQFDPEITDRLLASSHWKALFTTPGRNSERDGIPTISVEPRIPRRSLARRARSA
jgi:putative nucleotidyltransferase with HDIG domain